MPRRKSKPGGSDSATASATDARHIPVLLSEVLEALSPRDGESYIDATFGAGGYATAILDAADCRVTAFDRDPDAISGAAELLERYQGRLELLQRPFGDLLELAECDGEESFAGRFDGVVFDLGVSSMQLDEAERGFSFQADGPLDMRMEGANSALPSAADVLNTYETDEIADILFHLGEERRSRAIARAVVARREAAPFTRTQELVDVVQKVLGRGAPGKHPATRTFQALRIHVNDELGQLAKGLFGAERALKPGGRLVVVTFHSLEDRIVKRFISSRSGRTPGTSRHLPPQNESFDPPSFQIVNLRSLTSRQAELAANPRARSARLRSATRTAAAAWPANPDDLDLPGH